MNLSNINFFLTLMFINYLMARLFYDSNLYDELPDYLIFCGYLLVMNLIVTFFKK